MVGMTCRRILGWCIAAIATATAHAALVWTATTVEVTPKPGAEVATAAFRFVNTGPGPVTIEAVRPGCSCTAASIDQTTYAVGESGVVNAVVDLHGLLGVQEKTVSVVGRAEAPVSTTLLIRVRIPELIDLTPRVLIWQRGEKPEPKELTIGAATSIGIKLIAATCSDSNFSAKFAPLDGGRFRVSVSPFTTLQPHHGVLRLQFLTAEQKSEARTLYVMVE